LNEDLIRQIDQIQQTLDGLNHPEKSHWDAVMSSYLGLPGLRGFWPMSGLNTSGDIIDFSGHGLDLSLNGDPDVNLFGDYYSRADEALLDITGTDTGVNSAIQGLTLGCWFYTTDITPATIEFFFSKWKGVNTFRSYLLDVQTSGLLLFGISDDGISATTVTIADAQDATWHFLAGRFVPSTSIDIYLDKSKATNTTSIPASIYAGIAPLTIGANATPDRYFAGRIALPFLCAAALSDEVVRHLYQVSRGLFGV
jgi:hypothetical protein